MVPLITRRLAKLAPGWTLTDNTTLAKRDVGKYSFVPAVWSELKFYLIDDCAAVGINMGV